MKRFLSGVRKVDVVFHVVAGIMLAFMMVITLLDVIMRNIGYPIVGTVEIISFSGSVAFGFAIPYSSWKRAHIYVDFVLERIKPQHKILLSAITRCMGIALFAFIGYNFIEYGRDLIKTGEVSASFRLPYYPIAYGLAISCFLQSATLFCDLVNTLKEQMNE